MPNIVQTKNNFKMKKIVVSDCVLLQTILTDIVIWLNQVIDELLF